MGRSADLKLSDCQPEPAASHTSLITWLPWVGRLHLRALRAKSTHLLVQLVRLGLARWNLRVMRSLAIVAATDVMFQSYARVLKQARRDAA